VVATDETTPTEINEFGLTLAFFADPEDPFLIF